MILGSRGVQRVETHLHRKRYGVSLRSGKGDAGHFHQYQRALDVGQEHAEIVVGTRHRKTDIKRRVLAFERLPRLHKRKPVGIGSGHCARSDGARLTPCGDRSGAGLGLSLRSHLDVTERKVMRHRKRINIYQRRHFINPVRNERLETLKVYRQNTPLLRLESVDALHELRRPFGRLCVLGGFILYGLHISESRLYIGKKQTDCDDNPDKWCQCFKHMGYGAWLAGRSGTMGAPAFGAGTSAGATGVVVAVVVAILSGSGAPVVGAVYASVFGSPSLVTVNCTVPSSSTLKPEKIVLASTAASASWRLWSATVLNRSASPASTISTDPDSRRSNEKSVNVTSRWVRNSSASNRTDGERCPSSNVCDTLMRRSSSRSALISSWLKELFICWSSCFLLSSAFSLNPLYK